eukprot:XP_027305629.1 N66 matrix protein-like isoform X1 [Anas platyrhynchos]
MKEQICVALLAVCLLVLGGTKAAPLDSNSFNGNSAGDGSFNNNGNGFEPPVIYDPMGAAGNRGSFNWNRAGDGSFNNNGVRNEALPGITEEGFGGGNSQYIQFLLCLG